MNRRTYMDKYRISQLYDKEIILCGNKCKISKINMFKLDVQTFSRNYRVATLSSFYPTLSGIIIHFLVLIC